MRKIKDLHKKWSRDPEYRAAYEKLAPEFELIETLIKVRLKAGLTQEQLARRMNTTQSAIARLEGGQTNPSTKILERLAQATGTHLRITFEASKKKTARTISPRQSSRTFPLQDGVSPKPAGFVKPDPPPPPPSKERN